MEQTKITNLLDMPEDAFIEILQRLSSAKDWLQLRACAQDDRVKRVFESSLAELKAFYELLQNANIRERQSASTLRNSFSALNSSGQSIAAWFVNDEGNTVFHFVSSFNSNLLESIVINENKKQLVLKPNNKGETPLYIACALEHRDHIYWCTKDADDDTLVEYMASVIQHGNKAAVLSLHRMLSMRDLYYKPAKGSASPVIPRDIAEVYKEVFKKNPSLNVSNLHYDIASWHYIDEVKAILASSHQALKPITDIPIPKHIAFDLNLTLFNNIHDSLIASILSEQTDFNLIVLLLLTPKEKLPDDNVLFQALKTHRDKILDMLAINQEDPDQIPFLKAALAPGNLLSRVLHSPASQANHFTCFGRDPALQSIERLNKLIEILETCSKPYINP